jgi:hypothetical protein
VFRAYNPALGRWLSKDPLGEVFSEISQSIPLVAQEPTLGMLPSLLPGTMLANSAHARALPKLLTGSVSVQGTAPSTSVLPGQRQPIKNLYGYANNNPLSFSDPLGLEPQCFDDDDFWHLFWQIVWIMGMLGLAAAMVGLIFLGPVGISADTILMLLILHEFGRLGTQNNWGNPAKPPRGRKT